MNNFGENIVIEEVNKRRASLTKAMKTYRSKFSEEKRKTINDYQAKKMKERREKEREEKIANGIEVKIGRPKKRQGFTEKELKTMVDFLSQRVKQLEELHMKPPVPYWSNL